MHEQMHGHEFSPICMFERMASISIPRTNEAALGRIAPRECELYGGVLLFERYRSRVA
jgi:hypothetical protein